MIGEVRAHVMSLLLNCVDTFFSKNKNSNLITVKLAKVKSIVNSTEGS